MTLDPRKWLFPNSHALTDWELVLREIMGVVAYKIAGYI